MTSRERLNRYVCSARKVECGCGETFTTPKGYAPEGYDNYLRHFLDVYFSKGHLAANRAHYVDTYQ